MAGFENNNAGFTVRLSLARRASGNKVGVLGENCGSAWTGEYLLFAYEVSMLHLKSFLNPYYTIMGAGMSGSYQCLQFGEYIK